MTAACQVLDYPIVGGNVSLYNESKATGGGSAICRPGHRRRRALEDYTVRRPLRSGRWRSIYLIGQEPWATPNLARGHLGQSLWLREIHGRETATLHRSI